VFTGIVAALGNIVSIQTNQDGVRLTVDAGKLGLDDVGLGDSIAIQGACMTVVSIAGNTCSFDVSRESLNCTAGLDRVGEVNLEKAMRLADRIGGHLVSGHVDGLGTVKQFEAIGESWLLKIHADRKLAKFLAFKGSVTVNGVSLTVNEVVDDADGCAFSINLIPHTVAMTTLKFLKPSDRVNLEIDLIARYVERMQTSAHR
jgi:riboflavin synthase